MSVKDILLNKSNLCNIDCVDQADTYHPETCTSQVLMNHDTDNLFNWITLNGSVNSESSLLEWLQKNYPHNNVIVNTATNDTLGVVKGGDDYITIDSNGTIKLNIDALDIPDSKTAGYYTMGSIMLGNDTKLDKTFRNNTFNETIVDYDTTQEYNVYSFPLRLDNNNRAGITIPTTLFDTSVSQSDWRETDVTSQSFIKNKPTLSRVSTTGSFTDLVDIPNFVTESKLNDYYTKDELDSKLTSTMHYKGSVAVYNSLPEDNEIGDVYNVLSDGKNYAWDGSNWDEISSVVDLSSYYTKSEVDNLIDDIPSSQEYRGGTGISVSNNHINYTGIVKDIYLNVTESTNVATEMNTVLRKINTALEAHIDPMLYIIFDSSANQDQFKTVIERLYTDTIIKNNIVHHSLEMYVKLDIELVRIEVPITNVYLNSVFNEAVSKAHLYITTDTNLSISSDQGVTLKFNLFSPEDNVIHTYITTYE